MFHPQIHNSSSSSCSLSRKKKPKFLPNQGKIKMKQASSSSSCNTTSLTNRLKTIFKKANELSVLCAIEVCVIYYGPDGELKTWPKEREKVKDLALRYKEARKRKKSLSLHEFLEKEKDKDKSKGKMNLKKKIKKQKKNVKYPNFDHYSPQQLSQLIQSLEQTLSSLQERLCFVEAQKQRNTNLIHQTQPLDPSKFSNATLSQLPLTASHSNQLTNYQNHLIKEDLFGFGQNMCMDNITNTNFQHPCYSNTQGYAPLLPVQASAVNNYGLKNHLMQQQELNSFDQNMGMMSNLTNSNGFSNTVPREFYSDFHKNPYGDTVGNMTSFSQDIFPSYDATHIPSIYHF